MKNNLKLAAGSALAMTFFLACGEDEKEPAPTITYVTMTMENAPTTDENTAMTMTSQKTCNYNADSGLFKGEFTGTGGINLAVKIKNFAKKDNSYTCEQDPENTTGDISSATYTGCMVSVSNLTKEGSETTNTYSMHRDDKEMGDLTYAGACSISVKYASDTKKVTGTIACTKMIQTKLTGKGIFPINAEETADIKSDSTFTCTVN